MDFTKRSEKFFITYSSVTTAACRFRWIFRKGALFSSILMQFQQCNLKCFFCVIAFFFVSRLFLWNPNRKKSWKVGANRKKTCRKVFVAFEPFHVYKIRAEQECWAVELWSIKIVWNGFSLVFALTWPKIC